MMSQKLTPDPDELDALAADEFARVQVADTPASALVGNGTARKIALNPESFAFPTQNGRANAARLAEVALRRPASGAHRRLHGPCRRVRVRRSDARARAMFRLRRNDAIYTTTVRRFAARVMPV